MCSCFVFLSCCSLLSFLEGLFLLIGLRQAAGLRFVVRLPDWMFYSLIKSYSIDFLFVISPFGVVWYSATNQLLSIDFVLENVDGWILICAWFFLESHQIWFCNQPHFGVLIFSCFMLEINPFEFKGKSSLPLWKWLHFINRLKSIPITELLLFIFLPTSVWI